MPFEQTTIGTNNRNQQIADLLKQFDAFVKTEIAQEHLFKIQKEKDEVRRVMDKLETLDKLSAEFTDLVLYGLLPYNKTSVAKRVSAFPVFLNIRTFFGCYNYTEEEWNLVANSIYSLAITFKNDASTLDRAISTFSKSKYSRGLQCGSITPILFALNENYPVCNNVIAKAYRQLSELLGLKDELSLKLISYPENISKIKKLMSNPRFETLKGTNFDSLDLFFVWFAWYRRRALGKISSNENDDLLTEELDLSSLIESVDLEVITNCKPTEYSRDPEFISIDKILSRCSDTNWVLPVFQRYFDWEKDDLTSFLSSVVHGYYVGSFLLWDAKGEPELGVQPIKGVGEEERNWRKELVILDGQQRITSLYYAISAPNNANFKDRLYWKDTKIYREHPVYYYLNLKEMLQNPKSSELVKASGKQLSKEETFSYLLFPFSELKNHNRWLFEFEKYLNSKSGNRDKIDDIREEVRKKLYYIWSEYEIPFITLPKEMQIDQVTDIFEQLNTKGKPLSVFDLLVAKLFKYNINLKDLWEETKLAYPRIVRYSKAIDKIPVYILQAMSLYYHESNSAKKAEILNIYEKVYAPKPNYSFQEQWKDFSRLTDKSLERLENLRDGFGVRNEKELPFDSMIPVLTSLLKAVENEENKLDCNTKIRKWYWSSVFTNAYSSAAESKMTNDFRELTGWFRDNQKVPKAVTHLIDNIDRLDLLSVESPWNSKFRGTMSLIALEKALDFDTGQALENARENDKDHLFPKHLFGAHNNINSVLNMTWMSDTTNRYIKKYKKPSVYMEEFITNRYSGDRDKFFTVAQTHLIDKRAFECLSNDSFDKFLIEREKAVLDKLRKILELLPKTNETVIISPQTPFTNKMKFCNTLKSCQGYIHWVDKYFSKAGLLLLAEAEIDPASVKEIKVLTSIEKATEDFRASFKDLKDELNARGIDFQLRVITNQITKNIIHDRWIVSEYDNYNVPSPDVVQRGQFSEIKKTENRPPFGQWWADSLDIISSWDIILKLRKS